jgi:hypothetical protein
LPSSKGKKAGIMTVDALLIEAELLVKDDAAVEDEAPAEYLHQSTPFDMFRYLLPGMHCEYHSFCTVQLYPETHVVSPLHPLPPHWPQAGTAALATEISPAAAKAAVRGAGKCIRI